MKLRTLMNIGLSMLVVMAAACAPNAVRNPASISQMEQQAKSSPQKEYVISSGDVLDIKFMHNPDLNELALPVRPDGRISLQLAPDIMAAGLTPNQLKNVLTQKYSSELKEPEIAVIVRSFAGEKIFVDGEVAFPGLVDLRGPTTVMAAIAQARGLRDTARLSNVIVIRNDANGKPMAANLDLRKVINGTDMSQNIFLMPYDIVYVPRSNIARIDKFVDEYINRVVPGGFPGFSGFHNPYAYAFGGFTQVYPDTGATITVH
ncbi:MAG TPA: polysaccharide biosynthesis/export family protein [Syntrophorhabdaceae bacterium]|nr:polysaccharide biosynthesis/export family protein [Syntrophorhabdaceae bacterium]